MATKTLHEMKQEKFRRQNPNTITDSDYRLRDKEAEAKNGNPNTIVIAAPEAPKKAKKATAEEA